MLQKTALDTRMARSTVSSCRTPVVRSCVHLQVVPHDYDRAGGRRPGAGRSPPREALALVLAAWAATVHAVDQPGPTPGLDRDQRGQRYPLVAAAGHPHHRGGAAPAPDTALRRPQALARFVSGTDPGAQIRRRPFITGQVSSRQAAIRASSRSAARLAGTWTLHPIRCSSRSIPASV